MTEAPPPRDLLAGLGAVLLPLSDIWFTPPDRRDAAVLVPVVVATENDATTLLFTLRRDDLPDHPGQVSFPGGRRDPGEDPATCALREFEEELGLPRSRVQVVGALPSRDSSTGFHVHPIVGIVRDLDGLTPHPGEVDAVLHVPLADLRQASRWELREVQRGQVRRQSPHFAIGDTYLWGLTARITLDLLERLA